MECYLIIKKIKLNLYKLEGIYKLWREVYSMILFLKLNQIVYMCIYYCVRLYDKGEI